eukprot:Sspe_Gene.98676::Locus_72074_Transcript_1_1_Confidence_1.000_Length_1160::g.98676::m.98676
MTSRGATVVLLLFVSAVGGCRWVEVDYEVGAQVVTLCHTLTCRGEDGVWDVVSHSSRPAVCEDHGSPGGEVVPPGCPAPWIPNLLGSPDPRGFDCGGKYESWVVADGRCLPSCFTWVPNSRSGKNGSYRTYDECWETCRSRREVAADCIIPTQGGLRDRLFAQGLTEDGECRDEPKGWRSLGDESRLCIPVCWKRLETDVLNYPTLIAFDTRLECNHWCHNDQRDACQGDFCDSKRERCGFDVSIFRWRCKQSGEDDFCNGKCREGQGDCDTDSDCKKGLKCGKNNCREMHPGWDDVFDKTDDCCYEP